jgi:hypothetical protein
MTDLGCALLFSNAARPCTYILTDEAGVAALDARLIELTGQTRGMNAADTVEAIAVLGQANRRAQITRRPVPVAAMEDLIGFAMRLDGGAQ